MLEQAGPLPSSPGPLRDNSVGPDTLKNLQEAKEPSHPALSESNLPAREVVPDAQEYKREVAQIKLVSAIIESISAGDSQRLTRALSELGSDAGPAVLELIQHSTRERTCSSAIAVAALLTGNLRDKDSLGYLSLSAQEALVVDYARQLKESWSLEKRDDAAAALGRLRNSPNKELAVEALTRTVKQYWNPLNMSARLVNPFNLGIFGRDIYPRVEAIHSLGSFGVHAIGSVPELNKALGERWTGAQTAAIDALKDIARASKAAPAEQKEVFRETLNILDELKKGSKDKDLLARIAGLRRTILDLEIR